MATRPAIKAKTGLYTSVGIINSILSDPNNNELQGIPLAQATTESIRMVGQEITSYAARRNQFCKALINRIGMVRLHYMLFTNPWAWAKQGKLEMGETVEQIWIGLAEVFPYNPVNAETNYAKQAVPDVQSAFHTINYREVYKLTISNKQLKQAFLSLDGLVNFIESVIGSLARSANVDEFMAMKYLLAVLLLNGSIRAETISDISKTSADDVVASVAEMTNNFQFPSTKYNIAGVENTTAIEDLYILESARANAQIKVHALAAAFNIDEVKFMGNVVMYDKLGEYNWTRMDKIFAEDRGYQKFTPDQIALLNTVELIAMDRQFMQIYDSVEEMETPFINGEGAYTNYWYHVWKVLGASPFHNCIAYTTSTSSVTGITVSPATATVKPGGSIAMSANITTTGFGSSKIVWSVSGNTKEETTIDGTGILRIAADETGTELTVTATSETTPDVSGTATVTVEQA